MRSTEALLRTFTDGVVKQQEAIEKGLTASRQAARYIGAAEELLQSSEGVDAFVTLLQDEDENVRVMAASFLVEVRPKAVIRVLRAAAKGKGVAALGAQMTLARMSTAAPKTEI